LAIKHISGVTKPVHSYAYLNIGFPELHTAGIDLVEPVEDGRWSEAGPTAVGYIELPSGAELLLVGHLFDAGQIARDVGVEVRASSDVVGPAVAEELADELGVSRSRITWVRPPGWPQQTLG